MWPKWKMKIQDRDETRMEEKLEGMEVEVGGLEGLRIVTSKD